MQRFICFEQWNPANEQTFLSDWIYASVLKSTLIVIKYNKDITFR